MVYALQSSSWCVTRRLWLQGSTLVEKGVLLEFIGVCSAEVAAGVLLVRGCRGVH